MDSAMLHRQEDNRCAHLSNPMRERCYELETTKILVKTMQSSYKKKQINELILRIIRKVEGLMEPGYNDEDIAALKAEFMSLKQEAHSFMEP